MILPPAVLHLNRRMSKVSALSINCYSEICSQRQNSLVLGARACGTLRKPFDYLICKSIIRAQSFASCWFQALNQNSRSLPLKVILNCLHRNQIIRRYLRFAFDQGHNTAIKVKVKCPLHLEFALGSSCEVLEYAFIKLTVSSLPALEERGTVLMELTSHFGRAYPLLLSLADDSP